MQRYELPRVGANTIQAWKKRRETINKDYSAFMESEKQSEAAEAKIVLILLFTVLPAFCYLLLFSVIK